MFWISYFVTFVLASAITIALMAIRLVLSAAGSAFGSIPPLCKGRVRSRSRRHIRASS
jgi:hypothetical protein